MIEHRNSSIDFVWNFWTAEGKAEKAASALGKPYDSSN